MTLSIDADCALTYWMSSAATTGTRRRASHQTLMERVSAGNLPDWAYAPDGQAHVVATGERERVRHMGVSCQLAKTNLHMNAFTCTDAGVPIVSPEGTYLRLGNVLPLPELAKAGMLLCAQFAFDPDDCLVGRSQALATADGLSSYISGLYDVKGVKVARRALRFIADGAASPPEIDTCLLLCLPVMYGGYGCPLPELNGHIKLNPSAARTLGYADCYGDLLWRKAKCIVEYTSEQYHTGYRKQAQDEVRRAALESMGYRVFLLTRPQLYNQVAFEGIVRPVLRTIGKRMPKQTLEFQSKQYALRKSLLYEPSWIIRRACRMREKRESVKVG